MYDNHDVFTITVAFAVILVVCRDFASRPWKSA